MSIDEKLSNQETIDTIGKGSFGNVVKVKSKKNGKLQAWKEIQQEKMTQKERQQLVNEVNILRDLDNEYIVRQKDRIIDKSKQIIYIVMEFCEHGDISKLIKQCRKSSEFVAEEVVWKVLYQLLVSLNYIHTKKILHRDIKPGNLFIDGQKNIKLGDFGLSRALGAESVYAKTNVGTPQYMSPEVFEGQPYDSKSDMWSAGCLIYELANLRPPFTADTQWNLGLKIKEGRFPRLPLRQSEELMAVVTSMLNSDPDARPTAQQILQNKTLQTRGQDQQLRQSFALAKQKNDKLLSEIHQVDKKTKELQAAIKEEMEVGSEQRIDSQIQEIQRRLEQLWFKAKNAYNLRSNTKESASRSNRPFKFEDEMTPLRSIENNHEQKNPIRSSFKVNTLLDF